MRTASRCLVSAAVLLCVLMPVARAAQWVVALDGSGAFRSIQGAIDAAGYGDVVYVSPGVYEEHIALKDGVRVLGAGASSTFIRYAYGFEEVVLVANMGNGSLERVSVERLASVLPGPVVYAEAGAASLIDCAVSGGQGAGIDVVGAVASLRLERVDVTGNVGHGIRVRNGGTVTLEGCRVEENTASGLVVGTSSAAEVRGSEILDNGRSGVALEGNARLVLADSAVRRQSDWGLVALGEAELQLAGVEFVDNSSGAMQLSGTSQAVATRVRASGGTAGVAAAESAELSLSAARIENVLADAVSISGQAVFEASRLEVRAAGGHGIVLDTTAAASVVASTVIDCGGDGLAVLSGSPRVRQTILAHNAGAGIRLDAAQDPPPSADLAYNNVWANGEDYVGTVRPATDVTGSPEVVDVRDELALLPGSPCVEAGPAWATIGSAGAAEDARPFMIDFAPRIDGWLGASWTSTVRASGFPMELDALTFGCRWDGDQGQLDLEATVLGAWGARIAGHAEGATRWDADDGRGFAAAAYGVDGRLEGNRSWASAWVSGEVQGTGPYAGGSLSVAWPGPSWTSDVSVGLSDPVSLRLTIGLTDLALRALSASLSAQVPVADGVVSLVGSGSLLPIASASAEASWQRGSTLWRGRVDYRPTEDALRVSVSLGDAAARLEAEARVAAWVPVDGEVSLVLGGRSLEVRAALGLDSNGARLRAALSVAVDSLLRRRENAPPVPAFRTTPPDPEAGKPIRFLADEAADPDGEIREVWWDFGDGSVAEGRAADHAYSAPGTYNVILTVSDNDGAAASLEQPIHIWPSDTAPRAEFAAYPITESGVRLPRPLREGDRVRLDAGESRDLDGTIAEYSWDLGADGEFDVAIAEPATTVGPLQAGSHPITLRVIDDTGRSDAVMQVVVVGRSAAPLAQFSFSPPTPAVRDPVYFVDRSTDADGAVDAREWDFGDGSTSREANPIHRYERVGRFTVALRVTDDDGLSATAEQSLDVAEVPEIVDVGDVWAVLIGISDYSEVKDLQYASSDAAAMAGLLIDAGIAADHVRLLLDREGPLPNLSGVEARRATLVNVREALGWLRRVATPDDLVVIHFSGHGFQGQDDDGDERDGVDEFFILWDTLNAAKEDTALRDDEFGTSLDRIDSEHVVVFFDGCYSGGLSRSLPSSARPATDEVDLFSDFSVEGRLVFSASSESQDAFESDELKHGIFTHYVMDGLGGSADTSGDGRVTAWELYEHVARRVPERALSEHNARQDPQLLGEGDVRVLLAEAARPPEADFAYRPAIPYAGGPVAFADQSTSGRRIVARQWAFGDGTTSSDSAPIHVYALPGAYTVEFRVTQERGAESVTSELIDVEAPGAILSTDAASGLVVLSLGSDHGIAVGDRFSAGAASPSTIEVTELLEGRTSAGRVIEGPMPEPGAALAPL